MLNTVDINQPIRSGSVLGLYQTDYPCGKKWP